MADTNQMVLKSINLLREENAVQARDAADRDSKNTTTSLLMYRTMKSVLEEIRQDRLQNEEDRREAKTEKGKVAGAARTPSKKSSDGLGFGALGVVAGLAGAITGFLTGAIEGVFRGIKAIFQAFKIGLVTAVKTIELGFKGIEKLLRSPVRALSDIVSRGTTGLLNFFRSVFKSLRISLAIRLAQILDFIDDSTKTLRQAVRNRVANIFSPIRTALDLFVDDLRTTIRSARAAFNQSLVGRTIKNLTSVVRTIVGLPGAILGTISAGIKSSQFAAQAKLVSDAFTNTFSGPLQRIKNAITGLSGSISKTADVVDSTRKTIGSNFNAAGTAVKRFGSIIDDIIVRLYVFVDDTTKPLQRTIGQFAEDGRKVADLAKNTFGRIGSIFSGVRKFIGGIFNTIRGFGSTFGAFFDLFRTFGRVILFPITLITGIIDGISGFNRGLEESGDSMIAGVFGALGGVVAGIIGAPLDLLKSAAAWIAGKLGFENAEEQLNSFSFSDMIKGFFDAIADSILGFLDAMKDETGAFDFSKILKVTLGSLLNVITTPARFMLDQLANLVEKVIPESLGGKEIAEKIRAFKGNLEIDTGVGEAVEKRKATRAENQARIKEEEEKKAKAEAEAAAKPEAPIVPDRQLSTAAMNGVERENREVTSQAAINAIQIAPVTNSTNVSNTNTAAVISSNMPTVDNLDRSWAPA